MKICFFMDSINTLGGAQKCTITLANELVQEHYDVSIICTVKTPEKEKVYHEVDKRINLKLITWHSTINSLLNAWTKLFIYLNNNTNIIKNNKKLLYYIYYKKNKRKIEELQKYININNFDCVIGVGAIHTMILSLLEKPKNSKFIGWQHSATDRYFRMKNQFLWHQDVIFKETLNKLDEYVVLTDFDKKKIKEYFDKDVVTIPNPSSFICDNINSDRKKIILAVGRYRKVKGYDMLIKAFAIFNKTNKDYILRIVGDGPEKENLQNLINQLELNEYVELTGVSNNIMDEYLKADFFVLSSINEGFCMVIFEAMQCGLPIVTYDLPCVHDMLTDECGYIVEYMNIDKLADAMQRMANNPEKENMRKICKNQADKFKVENIIKEWRKIL